MKYRTKPVVIEAVQFTRKNWEEVISFTDGKAICMTTERCIHGKSYCYINTLEGKMQVSEGDYIIKGVNGEFYHCKPDVFAKTYEVAE